MDDHPLIAQGIKQILELKEDMTVVAQGGNGDGPYGSRKPDIILMDINMPDINGIQAISRLKELDIPSKLLCLQYMKTGISQKHFSWERTDIS